VPMYVCKRVYKKGRGAPGRRPKYDSGELVQKHKDLTFVGILLAFFAFVATIVCGCVCRSWRRFESIRIVRCALCREAFLFCFAFSRLEVSNFEP
jgi:hypothetical protein